MSGSSNGAGWPFHYDQVFSRLECVRVNGKGWKARCPAHDDDTPSLGLWIEEGRLAMNCLARGCALADIMGALGLHMSAVYPPEKRLEPGVRESLEFIEAYPYRDGDGVLEFEHVRWRKTDGGKTFTFRRPNPDFDGRRPQGEGNRKYIPNLDGCRKLVYRLPELRKALAEKPDRLILLVEGEKSVDYCRKLGLVATCNESGAGTGKFLPAHAEHLRGCHVAVIPDEDEPGRRHALACCLCLYGIAASVKLVPLEGRQQGWGLDDWLKAQPESAQGTEDRLGLLRKLALIVRDTQPWKPDVQDYPASFSELYAELDRLSGSLDDHRGDRAGILLARWRAAEPAILAALEACSGTQKIKPENRALLFRLAAAALALAR